MAKGNRNPSKGSKPEKLVRDALMVAVNREAQDAEGKPTKKLALLADKVVSKALDGDMVAAKEIFDRLDGKPRQEIEHSGEVDTGPEMSNMEIARRLAFALTQGQVNEGG
ncbi:hypothetical protein HBA54_04895 [Pelagibius litoralis]|uniref:Uncharacterized protein n=1 Tax=Pelagibius litoralis TaxID=374515 RepID=A0A967EWR1_9PROT|nr:hypothetical protein [Pelagibius litoralis]NIA67923.1 hypothetical protein [Pelagibius litoralis]